MKHPVVSVQYGFDLRGGWKACDDYVSGSDSFGGSRSHAHFVFAREFVRARGSSIPHDELEWIAREVRSHWCTDVTQPDECDFDHCDLSAATAAAREELRE